MKKFKPLTVIATVALGGFLVTGGQIHALTPHIKVVGKNGPISSDVAPYITKGTMLVPINIIGKLGLNGLNLSWDNTQELITISYQKEVITVKVNQKFGIKGDTQINLAEPAQIKNGRVMIPLRFVGELLGEKVIWDAKTQTVTIGAITENKVDKSTLTLERSRVVSLPLVNLKDQIDVGGLMTVIYYFPVGKADEFFVKQQHRIDYYKMQQGKSVQIWSAETTDDIVDNKGLSFFPYKIVREIGERPNIKGAFVYYKNLGSIGAVFYGIIDEQGKTKQLGEADGNNGVIVDIPEEIKYIKD